jgi:hypothetical protein
VVRTPYSACPALDNRLVVKIPSNRAVQREFYRVLVGVDSLLKMAKDAGAEVSGRAPAR